MALCYHEEAESGSSETESSSNGTLIIYSESESESQHACIPSLLTTGTWCGDANVEKRTRGIKATGKKFPFRAIPFEKINKENIRGPLLYFSKEGSDDPGDGTDPFVRTLEGKREDYELSEKPGKHSKVLFYSHTRTDTDVGDNLERKIHRLLHSIENNKECTHLWLDGACFEQALISQGKADVGFDDLRDVIKRCHGISSDTHGDYEEKPWCIVELEVWNHYKGTARYSKKLLKKGYHAISHDLKKKHRRKTKRQIEVLKSIVDDAEKAGMRTLPSKIKSAMDKGGV